MATIILSAVGTAIAGPFGGVVGALAGQGLDALIFGRHSARTVEGARLSDLSVQTASYGEPVPMVFGTTRLSGNLVWSSGLTETRHEDSQTVGGKGSSQSVTTVTYTYSASFAVALSARRISSIGRIWADGKLLRDAGGQMAEEGAIRIYTGSRDQNPDPFIEAVEGIDNVSAFRGLAYVMFENLELAEYANRIPNLTFEVIADEGGSIILSGLVTEICRLAGLKTVTADDLDQSVSGYVLSGQSRPRDILEKLAELYDFDLIEQNGGLHCRKLGRDVEEEFGEDVLLRAKERAGNERLQISREQELSLPREISISYLDSGRDYQAGLQRAFRQTGRSELKEQKVAPLVLTSAEAKKQAEALLENRWRRREKMQFTLPPGYFHLAPGDVLRLNRPTSGFRVMLLETEISTDGLKCLAVSEGDSLPAREVSADTGDIPLQQIIPLADSRLVLADLPSLNGEDPLGIYLVAATNAESAGYWPGAAIYLSRDGSSAERVATSASPAVTGLVENQLLEGAANFWDASGRLQVRLDHPADVLESRSEWDVLNGANVAIAGGEVLQFTSAQLLEPGLYELSGLLRGRRGTEDRISSHVASEPFLLVNPDSLRWIPLLLSDMGLNLSLSALTFGQRLEDMEFSQINVQGRSLRPFSPVHVRGKRDNDGNLEIHWVRRTRTGGAWMDGYEVGGAL
ncbi:phage tail protein [Emcibacter sp.]|uniref:phage tail protein n=1 Tax=Emcibacter sp. TaxID=1979954 RepID=UPI002AA91F0E|nr:phage tail protein [Emcibacter sp.]